MTSASSFVYTKTLGETLTDAEAERLTQWINEFFDYIAGAEQ